MKHLPSMQMRAFWNDESGQDLIEYALVAALIALGAVTGIKSVATSIKNSFTSIGTSLTTNI